MVIHPKIDCLIVSPDRTGAVGTLSSYLASVSHVDLTVLPRLPDEVAPYDVVITCSSASQGRHPPLLGTYVESGGSWLALVDKGASELPTLFGVQPSAPGPEAELRVLFTDATSPLADRLPDAIYVTGIYQPLNNIREDVDVILYADWRYQHSPMLTRRRAGAGQAACTTLQACDHPVLQQILYRLIVDLAGQKAERDPMKVGLLGYPPWLGRYHATAVEQIAGLELSAVCDISPDRLEAAAGRFPRMTTLTSADDLAADSEVGLVFIATPPNTHCQLSLQMMTAGKHVVCEKPLAMNRGETRQMSEMAEKRQVHLSCHQNRRWDADYLAVKQALHDGAIGELFYLETFVGGFNHPCGYWHSEATVSGGLSYDWGAHYLDWITGLMPDPPVSVIGTRHKRVWHDVTNADQERIQIRFAGGQEAEFIHSDIAAAIKPKWYLLGTRGAIVGNWQTSTALTTDPVVYYREEPVPITEKTPDLILYRRQADGLVSSRRLVWPQRQAFGFHRNLADHLLTGEPLGAPLADSMTVIAILEAAARSAAGGGCVEKIDG
jgi:predicted dehydrogenase